MKTKLQLATILGLAAIGSLRAAEPTPATSPAVDPCLSIYKHVAALVAEDPERILEIVSAQVTANDSCSCEVVKAAIALSQADAKTVAAIVEAAILAAPEHMRISAQCAIAVAPDAIAEVQAVLTRLDPNRGEDAAKSAKDSKDAKAATNEVAQMPNPLDFPGQGPVGPTQGGPGGFPLIQPIIPAIINPPAVSGVNP